MVGDGVNTRARAGPMPGVALAREPMSRSRRRTWLVKNDPADVSHSIVAARKVHGKIKQNASTVTVTLNALLLDRVRFDERWSG